MSVMSSAAILVVDDEEPVRRVIARLLDRGGYKDVSLASSSDEALELVGKKKFDLLLADVQMPGRSGLQLLERVRTEDPLVATLMVTGSDDATIADAALDLGAYGYILKPFKSSEVLINISNALRRRKLEIENEEYRNRLEEKVRARTSELWTALQTVEQREEDLKVSREDTIERLSIAAEFRDDETATHIKRMSRYCGLLAGWAGADSERSDMVRMASIMHDVGKIGIPDNVLLKPGRLNPEEYVVMQEHAMYGWRILAGARSQLLDLAAMIALTHHERCDGTGYPRGLRGDEIPLEGRVAAIADVFDAITSNRVYRKAMSLFDAVELMKAGRGSHFDPRLLDLFLDHIDEILTVKKVEEDLVIAL